MDSGSNGKQSLPPWWRCRDSSSIPSPTPSTPSPTPSTPSPTFSEKVPPWWIDRARTGST